MVDLFVHCRHSQCHSRFFALLSGKSWVLQGHVGRALAKHVLLQGPVSFPYLKRDCGVLSSYVDYVTEA